jgi:hypothetical protein
MGTVDDVVDFSPDPRRPIDRRNVGFSNPIVELTLTGIEKIEHLHLRFMRRNMLNCVMYIAGRCVVALTEAGGKDQDLFHQSRKILRTRLRYRAGICLDRK